jgi:CheY-like chemotaxis protein
MNRKANDIGYASVILVDDNDIDNYIHRRMLTNLSFAEEITIFTSAALALETLKGNSEKYPDALFVDLNMPVMDGFTFIRELKKLPGLIEKTRLIILTSSINQEDQDLAHEIDPRIIFFKKPLTAEMLSGI